MIRKFLYFIAIFFFLNLLHWIGAEAFSQQWQPMDKGFNNGVRILFADTAENIIYAGGDFTSGPFDNPYCCPIALVKWNGTTWDSIKTFEGSFVSAITKFDNKLFVGGNFGYIFFSDGISWDSISIKDMSANFPFNWGTTWSFYNHNNQAMYAVGLIRQHWKFVL